jgi:hypothetical protein
MLGQATWLDMIPGARQGVSYLLGQVAVFQRIPSRLTQIETAAIAAKRAAEARQKFGNATALALAIQAIGKLRSQQIATASRLADVLEGLRTSGLALTQVELGVMAARVATEVAAIINGTKAVEGTVYNEAAKVMSPSEVTALKLMAPTGSATPAVSPFVKYALFGGLLYGAVLIAGRKRKSGGRR